MLTLATALLAAAAISSPTGVPTEVLSVGTTPQERGPDWVVRSQSVQGSWAGDAEVGEVGTTALMLLGFLGDGGTTTAGPFKGAIAKGFGWLEGQADPDSGLLGSSAEGEARLLEHAWATLAFSELLVLEPQAKVGISVQQRSVKALLAQQREDGSFGDARTTAWSAFALVSAKDSKAAVPDEALLRARKVLMSMVPTPPEPSQAKAGELAFRALLGFMIVDPDDAHPERGDRAAVEALGRLLQRDGVWTELNSEQRMLVAYASFQCGGDHWKRASAGIKAVVLPKQIRRADPPHGGFPAESTLGAHRATAFGVMTLEVYFRYARIIGAR